MNEQHTKQYDFFVDAKKYQTDQKHLSGLQIKQIAGVQANYQLYLEEQGETPDKEISDSMTVSMEGHVRHFYAVPPATFGFNPVEQQLRDFVARHAAKNPVEVTALSNGSHIVKVTNVGIGPGWNRPTANVLFVVPPGYPAARPDCFWVEPAELRLADGTTPKNTNDANAIPGDNVSSRRTTWFSWHLQSWDPSRDTVETYFNTIMGRLKPAR